MVSRLSGVLAELLSHGLESHRALWDYIEAVAATRDSTLAKLKGCAPLCLCTKRSLLMFLQGRRHVKQTTEILLA